MRTANYYYLKKSADKKSNKESNVIRVRSNSDVVIAGPKLKKIIQAVIEIFLFQRNRTPFVRTEHQYEENLVVV